MSTIRKPYKLSFRMPSIIFSKVSFRLGVIDFSVFRKRETSGCFLIFNHSTPSSPPRETLLLPTFFCCLLFLSEYPHEECFSGGVSLLNFSQSFDWYCTDRKNERNNQEIDIRCFVAQNNRPLANYTC